MTLVQRFTTVWVFITVGFIAILASIASATSAVNLSLSDGPNRAKVSCVATPYLYFGGTSVSRGSAWSTQGAGSGELLVRAKNLCLRKSMARTRVAEWIAVLAFVGALVKRSSKPRSPSTVPT